MRRAADIGLTIIGIGLALALTVGAVRAADLGQPVIVPPGAAVSHPLQGCFLELSATGQFLEAGDREATGSVGLGCDFPLGYNLMAGAGARAEIGEDIHSGSVHARLGVMLNSNLMVYGLAEWRARDIKFGDNGALYIGAGAETTIVIDRLSAFVEASTTVSEFGPATELDDMQIRIGARYRFNGAAW